MIFKDNGALVSCSKSGRIFLWILTLIFLAHMACTTAPMKKEAPRVHNGIQEFQGHTLQRLDDEADYYLEMKPHGFFLFMVVYNPQTPDPLFDQDQNALVKCMQKIKDYATALARKMHKSIYYPDPDLDNFNFQKDFCTIEGVYDFK